MPESMVYSALAAVEIPFWVKFLVGAGVVLALAVALSVWLARLYRKVEQGTAIIRTGAGGTKVSFDGKVVFPLVHRMEVMDITVKRIEIDRMGQNGLICKDNLRADVKVAFFVRVNKTPQDVLKVAQALGCRRASDTRALVEFFDAKFSEALKTTGKQFDFVNLYTDRMRFKDEILKVIGTDLNGYVLDDAAIDSLEQTPLESLNPQNILDAEGIKKITDLTSAQHVLSNHITREKEKTIKRQDVEAREKILELERQQADAEQKQLREITEITARQQAEAERVCQEERLKRERAKIATEEELAIAEENKNRQIIVAARSRERTDKVEFERVEKDRQLEITERERVVALAAIERDKAVEVEKRAIEEVVRERVSVTRTRVEQEQKILDTEAFAGAERAREVAVVAEKAEAERYQAREVIGAEADRDAAARHAEKWVIEAEAKRAAAEKEADARKVLADAQAQEAAVAGLGEARAMEAKARAYEQQGAAQAKVVELQGTAEASKIRATMAAQAEGKKALALAEADGFERQGEAEAKVVDVGGLAEASKIRATMTAEAEGVRAKSLAEAEGVRAKSLAEAEGKKALASADADGITAKAEAMKLFHEAGREHEEFKLRLDRDLKVELAGIDVRRDVAAEQAKVLGAALEHAKIDIVGGDAAIFDRLVNSIAGGKVVDRWVDNSRVLSDVKDAVVGGADGAVSPGELPSRLRAWMAQYGVTSESVKNLTVAALVAKLLARAEGDDKGLLRKVAEWVESSGLGDKSASRWL